MSAAILLLIPELLPALQPALRSLQVHGPLPLEPTVACEYYYGVAYDTGWHILNILLPPTKSQFFNAIDDVLLILVRALTHTFWNE